MKLGGVEGRGVGQGYRRLPPGGAANALAAIQPATAVKENNVALMPRPLPLPSHSHSHSHATRQLANMQHCRIMSEHVVVVIIVVVVVAVVVIVVIIVDAVVGFGYCFALSPYCWFRAFGVTVVIHFPNLCLSLSLSLCAYSAAIIDRDQRIQPQLQGGSARKSGLNTQVHCGKCEARSTNRLVSRQC